MGGHPTALGALKPAEDGSGLILRVYEPAGGRGPIEVRCPEGWRVAGEVDLLEQPASGAGGPILPFQIRSFRLARL
jgi:alpha-mannosidase